MRYPAALVIDVRDFTKVLVNVCSCRFIIQLVNTIFFGHKDPKPNAQLHRRISVASQYPNELDTFTDSKGDLLMIYIPTFISMNRSRIAFRA